MTEYYNIPTQTLGASGLSIDLGVGGVPHVEGPEVYITIVETAGVAYTVQVTDKNNTYTAPLSVAASSPYQAKKLPNVRFLVVTGSGARVTGKVTDYEVNPDSILVSGPISISGTVNTDIGQRSNTLTGTNPVSDSTLQNIQKTTAFASGMKASSSGLVTWAIIGLSSPAIPAVSDGSNTMVFNNGSSLAENVALVIQFPVLPGQTYTLSGATLVASQFVQSGTG